MYSRLYKSLDKYDWLYRKRFGFYNSRSTNHAFIAITEKIREAFDKDEYAYGVSLDFQIVSDTVNHKMLFDKLALVPIISNK